MKKAAYILFAVTVLLMIDTAVLMFIYPDWVKMWCLVAQVISLFTQYRTLQQIRK